MFHMGSMLVSLLTAIMNFVTATVSILALLRALIRLNDACKRQKEQSTFLRRYQDELRDIKSVTQIIEEEEALQTAAIKAQLRTIETLSQSLQDCLRRLDPEHISAPRQFLHQLIRGLKDEKNVTRLIDQISRANVNLLLHVQVSGFKLTADSQRNLVANTDLINQVDSVIRDAQEQLRTAELDCNRQLRRIFLLVTSLQRIDNIYWLD